MKKCDKHIKQHSKKFQTHHCMRKRRQKQNRNKKDKRQKFSEEKKESYQPVNFKIKLLLSYCFLK